MKRVLITLYLTVAALLSLSAQSVDPCTQTAKLSQTASGAQTFTSNSGGNKNLSGSSYGYEMWTEGGNNNKLIWFGPNQGGGGAFRTEWNGATDYLGRIGYFWNAGKPYTDYKNIYCDFNFTRSANGTAGGYSYIGIYGWSKNPMIEWYIVDDWFGNGIMGTGTMGGGATKKGEFTVDGAVYFIYQATRPAGSGNIEGSNSAFTQFFSIRQTRRTCGTISVTEHFKKWKELGMSLGSNMYEAKFLVEAGGGTGWLELSYLKFSQEDQPRGSASSGFSLTVNTTPGGGNVTKTPDNTTYAANATVQLTAQPADGWKFDSWSGDATGTNATITVTMDKAKNITANFVQQTGFTLSTTISPATGGSVTASPAGGRYEKGTAVTLTPVASTGWKFDGWSGDATDSQNPLVITMDANKTITAKFSPTADGTTNLVKDGNFPGNGLTNNWSVGAYGNSAATASVSGGKATLNITAVGTQIYQPQLIQKGVSLEQGMKYRLTFTASAAAEKEINVMLQQSSDPYASYTQDTMFALTTAPQTFTLEFEMTSPSDANTQLSFNVGGTTQNVTISDVKLVYIAAFTDPELTGVSDISAGTSQSNLRVSVLSNSAVDVSFRAIGSGKTELRLYNLKGDVVASAGLQTFAGKSYSHTFDQKLPGGLYILWMYHNGHVEQAKVMVPR